MCTRSRWNPAQVPCRNQHVSGVGSAHAQFGSSVAPSGDVVIIGASAEMNSRVAADNGERGNALALPSLSTAMWHSSARQGTTTTAPRRSRLTSSALTALSGAQSRTPRDAHAFAATSRDHAGPAPPISARKPLSRAWRPTTAAASGCTVDADGVGAVQVRRAKRCLGSRVDQFVPRSRGGSDDRANLSGFGSWRHERRPYERQRLSGFLIPASA